MKKPIIEFKDFTFQYTAQAEPTLRSINLTIYEGEKVLIIGPSGSGKSTLAGCINGIAPFLYKGDMYGTLEIKGEDIREKTIFNLSNDVGTVLQDPDGQFIGLTVAEDIAFILENQCVSQAEMEEKVRIASEIVGAETYLDSSPHRLSGGQKQRVTLAGVMVNDVDILLFDEPLASLDPATGKRAIELIEAIKRDKEKTIIIIEHRLEDVLHCNVDRIILINDGEVKADMTPDQILGGDILLDEGIREPLYITALKYAGCEIEGKSNLSSLENLDMTEFKPKLEKWAKEIDKKEIVRISEPLLELNNIEFSYESGKEILKNISFRVDRGEILSIVGRNGSGKSTLSKLICGFHEPNSGEILFRGRDISRQSIKERAEKIALVMQNPNQMISKDMIFDEVALGLKARGIDEEEIERKVLEVLKVCGLYAYRNWPISALSFGQKKRVTIASMLVLDPELIILDEPTAGQDFKHYAEIMEFLKKLNDKGVTIVMITHDMHLMLEYTNRAVVLSEGKKIIELGAINVLTNKEVIERANLKRTSLYDLALKAELENPRDFVRNFIVYDRRVRSE